MLCAEQTFSYYRGLQLQSFASSLELEFPWNCGHLEEAKSLALSLFTRIGSPGDIKASGMRELKWQANFYFACSTGASISARDLGGAEGPGQSKSPESGSRIVDYFVDLQATQEERFLGFDNIVNHNFSSRASAMSLPLQPPPPPPPLLLGRLSPWALI